MERKGKERKGKERKRKERKGMEWKGKERKGKKRKGKERKEKERKGKERNGKERNGKERNGKERLTTTVPYTAVQQLTCCLSTEAERCLVVSSRLIFLGLGQQLVRLFKETFAHSSRHQLQRE